jgi:hypothetical protein
MFVCEIACVFFFIFLFWGGGELYVYVCAFFCGLVCMLIYVPVCVCAYLAICVYILSFLLLVCLPTYVCSFVYEQHTRARTHENN